MNTLQSPIKIPDKLTSRIIQVSSEWIENSPEKRIAVRPAKPLENIVEQIWYRTSYNMKVPKKHRWIFPGGNINIVFPLKGGEKQSAYIISSITRPAMIKLEGIQEYIGVRFKPGRYKSIFSFPIQELEKYYTWELSNIFPDIKKLENKLHDTNSLITKIDYIESFLIRKIISFQPSLTAMTILSNIIRNQGNISMQMLAAKCNVSQRQLQRLCIKILGVSPYTFCRVIRFLYTCQYIKTKKATIAQLAYDLGYSDQSHLIREFKKLSQYTPLEFIKNTEKEIIGRKIKLYETFPVQNPQTLL